MEGSINTGRKLTLHYSFIQVFCIMGYSCLFAFAAVFLLSRGLTNSQVGVTLTVASALSLISQPMVATFADQSKKLSLREITAIFFAMEAAVSLLLLLTPAGKGLSAILFILLIVIFSPKVSLVTALSMDHINNGTPVNFSLARGIGSLAYAALSFPMGFLVEAFSPQVVMIINASICIIGSLLVIVFPRPRKQSTTASIGEAGASGLIEFARKNKRFMAIIASLSVLFISHIFINSYTIQIIEHVGGDNSDLGIAAGIAGFVELPAMALFPWIFKKIPKAGLLIKISAGFFLLKAVVTLAAPNVLWIDIAQAMQFFTYAIFLPASVFYANEVIRDSDKVKGQALMGMSMGISGVIGNLLGGFMLDTSGGVLLMLAVGVAVSTVGLVMLLFIDSYKPQRTTVR